MSLLTTDARLQLEDVERRSRQIQHELQDPSLGSNPAKLRALMKENASLASIVDLWTRFRRGESQAQGAKEILASENDADLREMAREELASTEKEIASLEQELLLALLPRDEADERNVVLEVRPAAGGDEAALFAEELFHAYLHYAQDNRWSTEILSYSPGNVGGAKEAIALIAGEKVFSKLKYESGVHRVQRVPATETQGRIHTSTVTVVVLPEAEEVEVTINPNDLRIDVFRAGGSGGQSVNTTDSAVRVTHIPSGMVVMCQDEKSQIKNKSKALKVLMARLKAQQESAARQNASENRLAQIGTGDRSERIRTYNFPQSRITDHRIGLTIHQIDEVMKGHFEVLIDPILAQVQTEKLSSIGKKDTQ